MAGGPLAAETMCLTCFEDGQITRAVRYYEGSETDHYRCEHGHELGIDWRRGPAKQPEWPPDEALVRAALSRKA